MRERAIEIDLDGEETPRSPLERLERDLGERLVDDGLVSAEELLRARSRQAQAGGRLTSALWELGLVDTVKLRGLCGELLKTPCALPADVAMAPADALSLLSPEFVGEFRVIPFARNRETLLVATAEPWRLPLLDGVAQRTGCRVAARFVDEAPLAVLLEELYGVSADPRFKSEPAKRAARPPAATAPDADTDAELLGHSGELMSETAFEAIYQGEARLSPSGLARAGEPDASPSPAPPAPRRELPPLSASDSSTQPTQGPAGGSGEAPPAPEKPDPAVSDVLGFEDLWTPEVDLVETVGATRGNAGSAPPLPAVAQAQAALAAAADRDQLAWALSRFALSVGRRTVLFSFRDDLWLGWTGSGAGVDPARVATLMIPPVPGTLFGTVIESGAPAVGGPSPHPVHERFFAALGGAPPAAAGLFPIRFRDRIVLGAYLDGGPGGPLPEDLSDFLLLCNQVPSALERLARLAKARRG